MEDHRIRTVVGVATGEQSPLSSMLSSRTRGASCDRDQRYDQEADDPGRQERGMKILVEASRKEARRDGNWDSRRMLQVPNQTGTERRHSPETGMVSRMLGRLTAKAECPKHVEATDNRPLLHGCCSGCRGDGTEGQGAEDKEPHPASQGKQQTVEELLGWSHGQRPEVRPRRRPELQRQQHC